jgi:hypothetical protein
MQSEIERTIMRYYPQRALVSPLDQQAAPWDYDPEHRVLKAILKDLEAIDAKLRPGTRGAYDISEELVLADGQRLQICYLAPYAAWNYGLERDDDPGARELRRKVEAVLKKHGVFILTQDDLAEGVPWIQHGSAATVWNCLFVRDELS